MRARHEQKAQRTERRLGNPDREAAEAGIDIPMLRDNLALPVAERLRRHDLALTTFEMLRKARRL
jgi:hypothetical protein